MIQGIHHLTFRSHQIARTVDFYTRVLGFHLIKKTIRYDATKELHFYFGDETGTPGTVVSAWIHPGYQQGGVGKGQIATLGLSVPMDSVGFWDERLSKMDIPAKYPQQRGDEVVIYLEDPDGLGIELIANEKDERSGFSSSEDIAEGKRIRGIHSAEIWLDRFDRSGTFLTSQFGARLISEQGFRFRYGWADKSGSFIDIVWGREGAVGIEGAGAADHLGIIVEDENELWQVRDQLNEKAVPIGPLRELSYYRAFTFRDPEGILFELDTPAPGFHLDEAPGKLGQKFLLPIWENFRKQEILASLPPYTL